jgi:hypothetical protein
LFSSRSEPTDLAKPEFSSRALRCQAIVEASHHSQRALCFGVPKGRSLALSILD